MLALRIDSGKLAVNDIPKPVAGAEAVVRVAISGICNTDLEIVRGYAGFSGTIGHEFVGVAESAPGRSELEGKRVVGEINAGCGACFRCLAGDPRHCPDRTVLGIVGRDGAHAEYLSLPAGNLTAIPDGVSDIEAVFAEPLAAACGIFEQVEIDSDTRVAVVGDGKLGLLCAAAMAGVADDVTAIGKHDAKLEIAEEFGAAPIHRDDIGPDLFRSFDVVIEASGSEAGYEMAVDIVRPRGKIVLKSTFHGTPRWDAARVVVDEITIVGSRCGRFAPAIELLAGRRIDVTKLISDEFALADGVAAMEAASKAGVLKVLLRP